MFHRLTLAAALVLLSTTAPAQTLSESIKQDYDDYLWPLYDHFHRNPELPLAETQTALRMATELAKLEFDVHEGVGGTGVVAIMENGEGPLVMLRADMDGLPVEERSGLPNASKARQVDPVDGVEYPVMHACGHDMHMTSLIGAARQMAARRNEWQGTLMLIAQPAEERGMGARMMREDNVWERFGQPDYALSFHVRAPFVAGTVNLVKAPWSGVDSVDIVVHGIGGHGAAPHATKDPVVLGSQIVIALQTLVSRELPATEPAVVTVGSFHSGTKHNIISDKAVLQLTVRSRNEETRRILLDGIERIAINTARAAGLPEDKLPEVTVANETVPPTINDSDLMQRVLTAWQQGIEPERLTSIEEKTMGGEDFPYFTMDPYIPSVYWAIGGTPAEDFEAAAKGGPAVPEHHSALFKIAPEPSVRAGVESAVLALVELMAP